MKDGKGDKDGEEENEEEIIAEGIRFPKLASIDKLY